MSDTDFGKKCLTHYNDQHIQVRKDFLDLCAYNKDQYNQGQRKSGKTKRDEPNQECMAKILRLFETLTNLKKSGWQSKNEDLIGRKQKPLPEPREYRIEMAYSTIVRLLYNTYGESTVRNSIAALLQKNFIKRYQRTKNSIPEYVLNVPAIQQALNNQHKCAQEDEVLISTPEEDGEFSDETEVLHSTAQGVNSTPEPVKTTPEMVNSTPNNIEDKITDNKPDNRERTADVSPPDTNISSPPVKNPDIALMDTWDDICGERIPRDRKHKEAAAELARCGATREDLINNRDFCLRTNPQWYEKNGVDLAAIARNWGKWKSSLSHAPKQHQPTPTSAINPNSNRHLAKYFSEEELAEMGVN